MVSQLVKQIWCDHHQAAKDEEVAALEHSVTIDGVRIDVDLCEECAAPLVELQTWLETYGRPVKARASKAKKAATQDLGNVCPECGRTFASRQGRAAHQTRAGHQ